MKMDVYDRLEIELNDKTIPKRSRPNVSDERIRSITFGKVYQKYGGKFQDSVFNRRYPIIWSLIQLIGKHLPINYTSVQLNHNVTCNPHVDKNNVGLSVIVSFGNYQGSNIVIDGIKYDTYKNPIVFDGKKVHYNTPKISGNKYSLVFFSI